MIVAEADFYDPRMQIYRAVTIEKIGDHYEVVKSSWLKGVTRVVVETPLTEREAGKRFSMITSSYRANSAVPEYEP